MKARDLRKVKAMTGNKSSNKIYLNWNCELLD